MPFSFSIARITFSSGQTFDFDSNAIVAIVGPNNSGKSTALRNLQAYVRTGNGSPVIQSCEYAASGSNDELNDWLDKYFTRQQKEGQPLQLYGSAGTFRSTQLYLEWNNGNTRRFQHTWPAFVHLKNGAEQMSAATNTGHFDAMNQGPSTPIQRMYADQEFEELVSGYFYRAFGTNIFVNRAAGNQLPIHIGNRPELDANEREYSPSYLDKLRAVPQLAQQGDGMKSFAGAMLTVTETAAPVICLDEPELFLHPPQAQELGRFIAADAPDDKQLFIATHNASFIRGLLAGNQGRISIIRLVREGDHNTAHLLSNEDLSRLWSDPILRYSDALDGIFHQRVVICESDSDCHFYGAMTTALAESREIPDPNIMFVPVGGKHRVKTIVKALRALSVPVSVVLDIDALDSEATMQEIVTEMGFPWEDFAVLYKRVKQSFEQISPPLNANQVKDKIDTIFQSINTAQFTSDAEREIRDAMRATSPWRNAKRTGISHLSGSAFADAQQLIDDLRAISVYVLDVGEIERFAPSIGSHGPKWASAVLERDLIDDPELRNAREFIDKLVFNT